MDFTKIKKAFFIGVGGIGISALAKMMLSRGVEVIGVNDEESPKTLDPLREAGAQILSNQSYFDFPEADVYIYSDAWLHRGPEIIKKAQDTGKPTLSYFEALGEIAKNYKVIAISGTHGKTTTTAMIADVLVDAGLDPTVLVGSFVKKFGSNFREGKGEYLVVEADEYNKHLLYFHPDISVITNIEEDHLDCYKDLAEIKDTFSEFIDQTKSVLVCDPKQTPEKNSKIEIINYLDFLDRVPALNVLGEHNKLNAACALAVADYLKLDQDTTANTLAQFEGTWRRLEKRGISHTGTIIYDDYAHHPTEIVASLKALRALYPKGEKRIIVVFQPHLYSRTKAFFNEFAKSFNDADRVLFLPIYFAREKPDPAVSIERLAQEASKQGVEAAAFGDFPSAEDFVFGLRMDDKTIFVTMGAGEAYKIADKVFDLG